MPRRHPHCHGNLINSGGPVLRLAGVLVLLGVASSWCPSPCRCQRGGSLVQCQGVPEDYPDWVQNLSITNTVLPILRASTFQRNGSSLHNLTSLVLTNVSLQSIEAGAFSDLSGLTTLDLSLNALNFVPEDTFVGLSRLQVLRMNRALQEPARGHILTSRWARPLRSLQTLELSSNGLHAFPMALRDLENLQMVHLENNSIQRLEEEEISVLRDKRTLLYLSPNPIVCDCRVKDMVTWLQNSSQTLDVHQLRCSEPPEMNGSLVLSLNVLRLKCKNEDLETASYVFFGIVLALIGVIFLMVLYLNRRGIKRWINNFREACRDQMEGYHYRYEQDSDPRRSNAATGI